MIRRSQVGYTAAVRSTLRTLARAAPLLLPGLWLTGACTEVPVITRDPVPSAELLTAKDCDVARAMYQQRLALELPGPGRDGPAQSRKIEAFVTTCRTDLAGRARRVVLRCWGDSPDAATFLSCSDRF